MKTATLVISRHPFLGLAVARCLGRAGFSVHLMGDHAWSPGRFSRRCHRYSVVPPSFFAAPFHLSCDILERYCRTHGIEVLIGADVAGALVVSAVAPRLHGVLAAPVSSPELILQLDDKWRFVTLLLEASLPHPATQLVDGVSALRAVDTSRPAFVKPVHGANCEGAAKLTCAEDIDRYLVALGAELRLPLLAQEFIPGSDIDMSILADHGRILAWTIQVPGLHPRERVFLWHEQVYEAGRALMSRTGYHGVVHLDMRKDERDGSIKMLEANPRFWITTEHSMWAGVNFPALSVRRALGEDVAASFVPAFGPCHRPTIDVRLLAGQLLRGRFVPRSLPPASQRAWRDVYLDPAPQLMQRLRNWATGLGLGWWPGRSAPPAAPYWPSALEQPQNAFSKRLSA
jgi:predicted ATP-grasp superfamily ATP-dependent carboligase